MATTKKKSAAKKRPAKKPDGIVQPVPQVAEMEAVKPVREVEYTFQTRVRCPRCQCTDNFATHTRGATQYRECRQPICRHKWAEHGKAV